MQPKKISPLSRWISATNLVNIWYMIAVVCHLISKNVRTFHIHYWDCVRSFASLWASVWINSLKKPGPPPAMSHPNKPKKKTHRHLPRMQKTQLGGGFKCFFIFTPYLGKIPHVDSYFSNGLKPPTILFLGETFWGTPLWQRISSYCFAPGFIPLFSRYLAVSRSWTHQE